MLGTAFSYTITQEDEDILFRYEDKLFELIDNETKNISPESVVWTIDSFLNNRELTDRQQEFLLTIKDNIEYSYYLWDYAESEWNLTMTADECYENEYFDEEDQYCYVKDDVDFDDSTNFTSDWDESHEHEAIDESETLATYTIEWNDIRLISWTDSDQNQEVWQIFTDLIPVASRTDFALLKFVNDVESDTAAHVEQNLEDNTKWDMSINLSAVYRDWEFDFEEWLATLIHEYAHVLTLNKSQVRYYPMSENDSVVTRFENNCNTNLIGEWCLYETAYLDDFIDAYWPDAEFTEAVRNQETDAYTWNEDNFVSDYAATNPGEDIAESFTYFVLEPRDQDTTWASKKKNFFYNYKELDSLRKQIRIELEQLTN